MEINGIKNIYTVITCYIFLRKNKTLNLLLDNLKNQNFRKKINIFVKNNFFRQKSQFSSKITLFSSKIKILVKIQNIRQKSQFLSQFLSEFL